MRSHAKPLPPATDLSDTIGAFWMVPLPLRKYRDDGLVGRAGGAGRGVTGAVLIWQTVVAQIIGGRAHP
jgi:hypothetical protein